MADMPHGVDFAASIQRARERAQAEMARIEHAQFLQNRVQQAKKYTYGWFMALLGMEQIHAEEEARQAGGSGGAPWLGALQLGFARLALEDDFDMQAHLCANISFIYGSPGTGKTTTIASRVLIPNMNRQENRRILVLTPTEKSAELLIQRIQEQMGVRSNCRDWLVYLGGKGPREDGISCEREVRPAFLQHGVVLTTIDRYPNEAIEVGGRSLPLHSLPWDYIVMDEVSMMPLASILYPLYQSQPHQFILAGDPFQVEPVMTVSLWKTENIYTMVHLEDLSKIHTVPHDYPVMHLTTQYRSVPEIGELFSQFTYQGVLNHRRTITGQRKFDFGSDFDLRTLTIVKFPVREGKGLYASRLLRESTPAYTAGLRQESTPYHLYAALFTFELVSFLTRRIGSSHRVRRVVPYEIGIIAPYRAQADLMGQLLSQVHLPEAVHVRAGTIDEFQGDECDLVLAVFNPPPDMSVSWEVYLNDHNVINVAISRARDYLIVLMPDDETENIENLVLVKQVEHLIHGTDDWAEYRAHVVEQHILGSAAFIENHAHISGRQSVNVYGASNRYYEIRCEENAVDIQLHPENRGLAATASERARLALVEADGWSHKEILLLVDLYLSLEQADDSVVDWMAQLFARWLQKNHAADAEKAAKQGTAAPHNADSRGYDAVSERIVSLDFVKKGAKIKDACLPEAYADLYRLSQTDREAFQYWVTCAHYSMPVDPSAAGLS